VRGCGNGARQTPDFNDGRWDGGLLILS
jgi:hypothetical protein